MSVVDGVLGPKTFSRHLILRGQSKRSRKRLLIASLSLTSMVDMFSLLVIFLLQTFSTSPELLVMTKGVTLPNASTGVEIKDALKIDLGRDALPLIKEEYLRVGNFPAYRALRQLKKDSPLPSGEGIATTRTDVEYTYLSGRTLYHFFLEVDGENPQTIIDVFDQAAKTFSTK
jgi:hypothetical protein